MRAYNDNTNDIIEEIHDYCIHVEKRQIYLHGHISDSDEDDGTTFKMSNRFIKNMALLDKKDSEIVIHQHNIGGDWGAGMMIYDRIAHASSHISIVCHAEVMSMGTIITQAADIRYGMPHCVFMFHHGFSDISGNQHLAAQSWAAHEKDMENVMINIYAEKCKNGVQFEGKSLSQVKTFIKHKFNSKIDWFLTSEKAKEYGFIDKVIGLDCELKDI